MRLTMPVLAALLAGGLHVTGVQAHAAEPAVYTGVVAGVGVGGYDPVAYFRRDAAIQGSAALPLVHDGVTYRFESEENRRLFAADPERYLPRFGGYCAWAVAEGYTAHGDPEAWSVVEGRLYLNYSPRIRARWERDTPGNIAAGEANWPKVLE